MWRPRWLARRSPRRPTGPRGPLSACRRIQRFAVHQAPGHVDDALAVGAGAAADALERRAGGEPLALHQDALGLLDQDAAVERVAEQVALGQQEQAGTVDREDAAGLADDVLQRMLEPVSIVGRELSKAADA